MEEDPPAGRLSPQELKMRREYLGLTLDALAGILSVRPDTVRRWETGRIPVPYRVRDEIAAVEQMTAQAVEALVAELSRGAEAVLYRSDEELHQAKPETQKMTARWWRHVTARACDEVPDAVITADDQPSSS